MNLTANYSINNIDYRRKVYENPYVGDGTAGPGRLNQMSTRTLTQTFNQLITYNKSIGNHNFDVLLGHETMGRNASEALADKIAAPTQSHNRCV